MPTVSRTRALVVLVVSLVVIVLAAALSVLGLRHLGAKDGSQGRSVNQEKARIASRAQVLGAAGQLAVDFTSIDYRNLNAEFQATSQHATSDFAKKYLATVKAFAPLYKRGKVVQSTSVESAGIQALSDDSAVVLVALKGIATNTESPNGSEQLFRMQVDLSNVDGAWLASNVQPI
jgi:hypothetical protein